MTGGPFSYCVDGDGLLNKEEVLVLLDHSLELGPLVSRDDEEDSAAPSASPSQSVSVRGGEPVSAMYVTLAQ